MFDIEIGHIVANKYELIRMLASGAMGEVWLAQHLTLGEEFAVKFLRPGSDTPNDEVTSRARFLFEAQATARLSRKTRHIVRVTDHGQDGELNYLVMERLDGESFEETLDDSGAQPLDRVREIVAQIARGLAQAHAEGVFHRDLKPANVFLCRDDDGGLLVKILDFGLAHAVPRAPSRPPRWTGRGVVLGTPSHMSPEQARGLALDPRCDLWALSVIAFEALTGESPIVGKTLEDVFASVCTRRLIAIDVRRPDLAAAFDPFFARAFAENVDDRFQTAQELAGAFEAAVDAADGVPARALVPRRRAPLSQPPTPTNLELSLPAQKAAPTKTLSAVALVTGGALALIALAHSVATSSPPPTVPPPAATLPAALSPASAPPFAETAAPPEPPLFSIDALPQTTRPAEPPPPPPVRPLPRVAAPDAPRSPSRAGRAPAPASRNPLRSPRSSVDKSNVF
jgi:eukaryotic-like serine/threonine-protein kinase